MVMKKLIPDTYTEYKDGSLGVVAASLANAEAKIGAALGGVPGKAYTLSGPDAKKNARTIFKGGPLLRALEEAFNAGSSRIHAIRLGTPTQASVELIGLHGEPALLLRGDYGASGDNHQVYVRHQVSSPKLGYVGIYDGSPRKVFVYDANFQIIKEINLTSAIPNLTAVRGVCATAVARGAIYVVEFWVVGAITSSGTIEKIWHFDANGTLLDADTRALTGLIPDARPATGIFAVPMGPEVAIELTSTKHALLFEKTSNGLILTQTRNLQAAGITNAEIEGADRQVTPTQVFNADLDSAKLFCLDLTAKALARFDEVNRSSLGNLKSLSLTPWLGTDSLKGVAVEPGTGNVLVAIAGLGISRVVRLAVDWDAVGGPTADLLDTVSLPALVEGIGAFIADAQVRTTVTVEDLNFEPPSPTEYSVEAKLFEVLGKLETAINAGGVHAVTLLEGPTGPLLSLPLPMQFTGGSDGGELTNLDYLDGLAATEGLTEVSWIHAVGANTEPLWTAILLHCDQMQKLHQAERFAILEVPAFVTAAEKGTAAYLTALQTYVDTIADRMAGVADRNAVVFVGGARFLGSDGVEYDNSITAACGGTMAGLEVQKSLINKQVPGVLELLPEFGPGHLETLIQARCNCIRFKPGRGFVITHSLTGGPSGTDYSRVNDLRAVYYGSKAAREAAQLYVGEENDSAGEGLRRLESAMSRPLEQMKDAGQIDAFELTASSTANDRLLGDVYVSLGIQPRRAMEMIYTTVYLK